MTRSSYPLLFERSMAGHRGADLPPLDVPAVENLLPAELTASAPLPPRYGPGPDTSSPTLTPPWTGRRWDRRSI